MPNRIIKESIRLSKKVNALNDFQFRLWTYLITYVDDYGRGMADVDVLKGALFPRRKGVTEKQLDDGLRVLANTGMILLYKVDGESYFCFPNWRDHQTVRAKKSKYPSPDEADCKQVENTCKQMKANVPVIEFENRDTIIDNRESKSIYSTEPTSASVPPVIALPLNTGDEYPIYQDKIDEWQELYPAVDVLQQLRNMKGWCDANPKKRKTEKGILRFCASWLAREQDRAGSRPARPAASNKVTTNPFAELLMEECYNDEPS